MAIGLVFFLFLKSFLVMFMQTSGCKRVAFFFVITGWNSGLSSGHGNFGKLRWHWRKAAFCAFFIISLICG